MSKLANLQAYPSASDEFSQDGMTIRQYAAIEMMKGLISNPSVVRHDPNCGWRLANSTESQLASYADLLGTVLLSVLENTDA